MKLLELKKVSVGYEGLPVIKNLSFSVDDGDYLCIVGENGTGKSTLIKTILGLLKPISGTITMSDSFSKTDIGYLPQQTIVQKDFPASVWEVVTSGLISKCGFKPFYTKAQKDLARENIKKLKLSGLEKKCYRELSGGQQQRVLLARALCATQKVLLLDEPVSSLDPKVTKDLYEIIYNLNKKDGITIIMISHDIKSSLKYASHILHLTNSDSFFGTTEDYIKSDIGKKFLGMEENNGKFI